MLPVAPASLRSVSWTPQDPPAAPPEEVAPGSTDEVTALDGLEADLAAVEQALQRLDAVQLDPGADVVASIATAVPAERFDVAGGAGRS